MKKILCMIFCLCLLFAPIGGNAQEVETETDEALETDGVKYTVYTTDNQVIARFENINDTTAFISETNVSFYDEAGELIDTETMEALFVDAESVNYGKVTYYGDYASVEVVPYVYEDEMVFDYNEYFETVESFDEEISELYVTVTNTGDKEASAMLTVVYYKDGEVFYVAPDIGEIWLYAGDSQEVTIDLPHDEEYNFLEYDDYEILIMGYALE